jgi:carbamoyl-phosphate synthase large subunit
MKKAFNILVTGCGGDIGQSIGKILVKHAFTKNLYGIDISVKNAAQFIYPNFSVGLRYTHPGYLSQLKSFIENYKIDIFIPISEPELRYFSEQNILDSIGNAKMITASALALEIGFDKYKTAQFLKQHDLPFPKTTLGQDVDKIVSFPIVLKSRTGSGSKDIHIINTTDEFLFYIRNGAEQYIIQEFIDDENGEFTCGLFRSKNGEIRSIILKRELLGGYTGYGEVIDNKNITLLLEKLAQKLKLEGCINVQLRLQESIPKVFEINPRFSSTVRFRDLFGFKDVQWSIEDKMNLPLSDYIDNSIGKKLYKGFNEYIK